MIPWAVSEQHIMRRPALRRQGRLERHLRLERLENRTLLDAASVAIMPDAFDVRQNRLSVDLAVLENDSIPHDYDGPGKITSTSFGSKGGLIRISEDARSLEYVPPADGFGAESFTYYVDHEFSAEVTITIVTPLEHDRFVVHPDDSPRTFDVLANDPFWTDYDGARQITSVSETRLGGMVEVDSERRTITYTPPAFEVGKDAFLYFVDDLYPAEVIIDIPDPLGADRVLNLVRNSQQNQLDVLANDLFWVGYEGERKVTHLVVRDTTQGSFSIAEDQLSVSYTPQEGFAGYETVRYVVDGRHETTLTVQVHRPTQDGYYYFPRSSFDSRPSVELEVLANDEISYRDERYPHWDTRAWITERGGVDHIVSVGETSAGGVVTISANGTELIYTPPADFHGSDRFEYVAGGPLGEHPANVRITIAPTGGGGGGHPPPDPGIPPALQNVCRPVSDSLVANQNSVDNGIDVLANDFHQQQYLCDPYEGERSITSVSDPASGTVQIAEDRKTVSYTPDEDFFGSDSFTYAVDGVWVEHVTVNVVRRVRDDQFRVDPDSENELSVLVNDLFGADYTGAQQINAVTESSAGATVAVHEDRTTILYSPPAGFEGEDHFTYTVDGGLKAQVTVFVNSSREALLRRFNSEGLFGSLLQNALDRYEDLFGTSSPWYRWVYYDDCFECDFRLASFSDQNERIHSETNVQVQGIDEADIVDTDDDYLYVVRDNEVLISQAWPADELSILSRTGIDGVPIGLYLHGDRLTVVSQDRDERWGTVFAPTDRPYGWRPIGTSNTVVTVLDVTNRAESQVVQKTKLEGRYVESRRIDDHVFVVLRNQRLELPAPQILCDETTPNAADAPDAFIYGSPDNSCTYESRDEYVARASEVFDSLLPHFASYDADGELIRTGLMVTPDEIFRPQDESARNMVSVVSISMSNDEPGLSGASGILTTGADTVYGGWNGLYVLDRGYTQEDGDVTRILKFDWNADTGDVDLAAHGQVAGYLLNQFSVDEHAGYLRIATTISNQFAGNHSGDSENTIFVLEDDGGLIEPVGDLQNLGFRESIKSVRFVGARAFVTTFREIDPFFVIDMSDPTEPLPVGHVTLPGFNSYMQMIDENHVLTIGTNTVTETTGATQVILFDVSDVMRPRIVGRQSFYRDSTSLAANDHHAFGWFQPHGVLAIPLAENRRRRVDLDDDGYPETWEYYREDTLALLEINVAATVDSRDGVQLRGEVASDSAVLRGAFIDNILYSIAHDSITAVDIQDPASVFAEVSIENSGEVENDSVAPATGLATSELFVVEVGSTQPGSTQPLASEGESADDSLEAMAQQMANRARDMITSELDDPLIAPLLVAMEIPDGLSLQSRGCTFIFDVGDRMLQLEADAEGEITLVDDAFDFDNALDPVTWQNPEQPEDVNGDEVVTSGDVLLMINKINKEGAGPLRIPAVLRQVTATVPRADEMFYDVTGEGLLTSGDVLQVINWLNGFVDSAEAEFAAAVDLALAAGDVGQPPEPEGPIELPDLIDRAAQRQNLGLFPVPQDEGDEKDRDEDTPLVLSPWSPLDGSPLE
jgi:hypothetical protein